jgi:hypothetical protein
MEDVVVDEVARTLARTAVRELRRLQRRLERENADIGLTVSLMPAVGDAEMVVFLDTPAFHYQVELMIGDSPRTWLRDVKRFIAIGRQDIARQGREPSPN